MILADESSITEDHRAEVRPPQAGISIVRFASWVALAIGSFASLVQPETDLVLAAVFCGAAFPVVSSLVQPDARTRVGATLEIVSLMGSVTTAAAVALTGNTDSPFMLLALMPSLFASIVAGFRAGLVTSLLSASLIGMVALTTGGTAALTSGVGMLALFPLISLVVAQIRALLVAAEDRALELARAGEAAATELALLSQANELLRRLTDIYGQGFTNPVRIGHRVIQAVLDTFPGGYSTATLFDQDGPVVVARAGTDSPQLHRYQFPLGDQNSTSGVVSLGTPRQLSAAEEREIQELLRPLSVAFINAVLLQQIAEEAVTEERLRLARELHDEVGPSLAALGLALDGAAMSGGGPHLADEIIDIRRGLGQIVDDLRGIIADLRAEDTALIEILGDEIARYEPPPEVVLEIRERRTPPSPVTRQILSIVNEAVRNAHRHGSADRITVSGTIDRHYVDLSVVDDGDGFDPALIPEGHFGVMGMRERADKIGATLTIDTGPDGTRVAVAWRRPE